MKKIKLFVTVIPALVILASLYSGCEKEKEYPFNIIVLLDTSDRVSGVKYSDIARDQVVSDIRVCRTIIDVFKDIVRREKFSISESKLRFFVPPQQGIPISSEIKAKLLELGKVPIGSFRDFEKCEDNVVVSINKVYNTIIEKPECQFTGSDIWSWFAYDAERYMLPQYQNYIICLSDGYLDFNEDIQNNREKGTYMVFNNEIRTSNNWREEVNNKYKLLTPQGVNFSSYKYSSQFLMIGIRDRILDGSMRDREIIEAYWKPWLNSMGITPFRFVSSDISREEIKAFLEGVK